MVKSLIGFLFLILVVLLETSVLPFFPLFSTQPSLLLIILLTLQFLRFSQDSYYGAFFGGALLDLLTGRPLGFSSLTLLLLSGAAGRVQRFAEGSLPILLLLTFIASMLFRIVQVFPTFNMVALFKGGVLDAVLMFVIYPMLRYLLRSVFAKKELTVGV